MSGYTTEVMQKRNRSPTRQAKRTRSLQNEAVRKRETALRRVVLIATLLLLTAAPVRAGTLAGHLQSAFRLAFGESTRYQTFVVDCDTACRATITVGTPRANRTLLFARAGTRTVGWGVVDNVMGKEQPITYLLIVDRNLQVRGLEILAYRETRGAEIQRQAWRQQFVGKTGQSDLKVGKDIDAISGATISTNAVSEGAKRLLQWLHVLQQQKRLP